MTRRNQLAQAIYISDDGVQEAIQFLSLHNG
jgi:hypothetical protein